MGGGWSVGFDIISRDTQHAVVAYGARRPDLPLDSQLVWQFFTATRGFTMIRASGTFNKSHGRRRATVGA